MTAPKTDAELVAQLRAALQPQGTAGVVNLSPSSFWLSVEYIERCLATIETKTRMSAILEKLGDEPKPLNPLEQLAIHMLAHAAGVRFDKKEPVDAAS